MKNQIIIIYKDRTIKVINSNKIYKYLNKLDTIVYLLFQSISNPSVYYPIKPSNILLGTDFKFSLTLCNAEFDYDERQISSMDTAEYEHHTQSIVQFIDQLSVFYRNVGCSEIMEYIFIENNYNVRQFFPIQYKLEYIIDGEKETIIGSSQYQLNNLDGISIFEESLLECLEPLSEILYITPHDMNKLPLIITINNDTWKDISKVHDISNQTILLDNIIMIKLNTFSAYHITTFKEFYNISKCGFARLNLVMCNNDKHKHQSLTSLNQTDRCATIQYLLDEMEDYINYEIKIADPYAYFTWKSLSEYIITYIYSLFKPLTSIVSYSDIHAIIYTDSIQKYILTPSEAMNGGIHSLLNKLGGTDR